MPSIRLGWWGGDLTFSMVLIGGFNFQHFFFERSWVWDFKIDIFACQNAALNCNIGGVGRPIVKVKVKMIGGVWLSNWVFRKLINDLSLISHCLLFCSTIHQSKKINYSITAGWTDVVQKIQGSFPWLGKNPSPLVCQANALPFCHGTTIICDSMPI